MVDITGYEEGEIPTLAEFMFAESADADCRSAFAYDRKPNTRFNVDSDGVLVRVFSLIGASRRVVSAYLRPRFLHSRHYFFLASHSGERQIYDCMRKELYWPHTTIDVYTTVQDCHVCAQKRTHGKPQGQIKLFFSESPLEYMNIDILEPLRHTEQGSQFVVVISDRCNKLTKVIRTTKTNATIVASIFLGPWGRITVFRLYYLPKMVLQFVSEFFVAVCNILGVHSITNIEHHLQNNSHT